MRREDLTDLNSFLVVAEEGSFTRAAIRLETSQSAVSNTVRRLEERLGVRLITRTTRKVVLTKAGERLLNSVGPAFSFVDSELTAIANLRDRPAGLVRISTSEFAAHSIVWPAAKRLMTTYPDIQVEISIDATLTDIVDQRFDAGVRLGELIAQDMISVRIGPDVRMVAVASPTYLEGRTEPNSPHDLAEHICIAVRAPTRGSIYAWEFEKDGDELKIKVQGQFTSNSGSLAIKAAIAGLGIAFVPDFHAEAAIKAKQVKILLEDWCQPFPGFHLYYPNRRHHSPAFSLLLQELQRSRR